MKKITLLAVAALAISFASCKKDYTCSCTTTNGSSSATSTTTIHAKKSDAQKSCDAGTSTATSGGQTVGSTCTLK